MYIRISSTITCLYFFLAIAVFYTIGDAMLNEETHIQLFADSSTYEKAAYDMNIIKAPELILNYPNYFGMIYTLKLMNGSRWGILFLNMIIFALSIRIIVHAGSFDRKLFVILLCANPMTFSSLLSINKEIFAVLTIALMIYGINKHNFIALLACLMVSFFVRWQMTLFVIAFWILVSPLNIFRHRRLLTCVISIVVISVFFYVIGDIAFSNVTDVASEGVEQWEGTGLWGWLLKIQYSGGYFIVFPLKSLHSMFGILAYIKKIIDPPEFYNYVVVMLHSLTMLFVMLYAFMKRKFILKNNVFYIAVVYLLIFGLTPIYAPRYFYPVFVLLCVLATERPVRQENINRL